MNNKFGASGKTLIETSHTRPFSAFEWTLAGRYLRARRKEGFISVIAGFSFLGIMLGVATLIIVMAVMNGFRKELLGKMLGLNGHVVLHSPAQPFTNYLDLTERLKNLNSVEQVLPLIEGQTMVSTSAKATGALVRGVQEKDLKKLLNALGESGNKKVLAFGSLDGFDAKPSLVIGTRMANDLGVRLGESITMVSPEGATTPFGRVPRVKKYPISAIFEIGMSEYDSSVIFMPLKEAQLYFNKRSSVDAIEIIVDKPDEVDRLLPKIQSTGGPSIFVTDWRKRNSTFFDALEVERSVMFMILTLIVLVAAFNIISGMIMLVKDKSRDIAVLRTMGASRGSILRIFFITGASIGFVGTFAGFLVGVAFSENIEAIRSFVSWITNRDIFPPVLYFLSEMPAEIEPMEVIQVVGLALFLSILATIYPSWRAATLDPVEALRYE